MVFCFLSMSCIRSAAAAALVLGRMALEERAILAVPSPSLVLRDGYRIAMALLGLPEAWD